MFLSDGIADKMITEVVETIKTRPEYCDYSYLNVNEATAFDKRAFLERHAISGYMFESERRTGLLSSLDESAGIMLNEEDHIRIQCLSPGDGVDEAYKKADAIDDTLENTLKYAFDGDYGYLTSCPTNAGTGLRVSYMTHLPFLESSNQLKSLITSISKFGMTVRGIYGEGSESLGSIYQISNQVTLGKSEEEIILSLRNITRQVIEREINMLEKTLAHDRASFEDNVYRSYGVLSNCRKISAKEAMTLLSNVRLGFMSGVLKVKKPPLSIYNVVINIQPASLIKNSGRELADNETRDVFRAQYIRNVFSEEG
jgi:protein arginine kinase